MLYSEFLEGTKSSASEYNYKVFENLNNIYMENEEITKSEIYEIGKKLVREPELSKTTIELIANAQNEIKQSESSITYYKDRIETMKLYIEISTPEEIKAYKQSIKNYKEQIRKETAWIKKKRFFLNGIAF